MGNGTLTEPLVSHLVVDDDGDPLLRVGRRVVRVDQHRGFPERHL